MKLVVVRPHADGKVFAPGCASKSGRESRRGARRTQAIISRLPDLFTFGLRNDDIQEFDSKWDGILLSMTKIPPDDILEGLYKFFENTRV